MAFRDEVRITVHAGNGGDGRVSFRREKYVPKGGPDGGDGGKGGDVILEAASKLMSLEHLAGQRDYRAGHGVMGGADQCYGKSGADLKLEVPPGTLVKDAEKGHVLKSLDAAGERVVIVNGGKGGRGNARFATATDRVPRKFEPGVPGEVRELVLELKLIADVGLVGFPNAGKSTLLGALSAAKPKVGAWPFTTLTPNVGIVYVDHDPYVIADVPGLIEGASSGKGLGDRFLKHVERTRVLLHLVDASDPSAVAAAYRTVRQEIERYGQGLEQKPEIVLFTKLDLLDDEGRAALDAELGAARLEGHRVSAATGEGLDALKAEMVRQVARARAGA